MELRELVYFLAVVDNKSISQAASRLYISQPTVTMAVKRLEKELGADLLERRNTGIRLTPAGEIFYRHATLILAQVETAKQQIELQKEAKKTLYIGVPSMACSMYYPIIYQYFQGINTDIQVRIKDLRSPEVVRQICTEDIELGLALVPRDIPASVQVVPLKRDRIRLMLPKGHRLTQYETVPLAQAARETVFMSSGKTYIHDRMREVYDQMGLTLMVNESFNDNQTIVNMVANGFGVYFFPSTTSTTVMDNPRIALRDLDVDLFYDIALLYKKNKHLSEPARRLADFLMPGSAGRKKDTETPCL